MCTFQFRQHLYCTYVQAFMGPICTLSEITPSKQGVQSETFAPNLHYSNYLLDYIGININDYSDCERTQMNIKAANRCDCVRLCTRPP